MFSGDLPCVFLVAQKVENRPAMKGDLGSVPGLGRSPGNSLFLINLPWLHKMLTLGESWVKGIQEFFILCNSLYSVIYIQIYNYFQIKKFF